MYREKPKVSLEIDVATEKESKSAEIGGVKLLEIYLSSFFKT
jgi:hypothetical protein